jgi:hypothetical protein
MENSEEERYNIDCQQKVTFIISISAYVLLSVS